MRVSRASPSSRALPVLALAAVLALLAGCAPSGGQSERVVPSVQPLYPTLRTYPDIRVVENVRYGSAAGETLDVCLPKDSDDESPRAAVVSIHGGSWRAGDKSSINWRSVCQWLASTGFVAFSVDYGLAPLNPFPAGIDDVRAAVRYIRDSDTIAKYDLDPKRVGAFGGSAGGNLAALLGTEGSGSLITGTRVAAVAELSGPTNLTADGSELEDFLPLELSYLSCASFTDCPNAKIASPLFQVDRTDPPFFVGHSLTERIPLSQSKDFVAALRKKGVDVTFVTVQGHLHSIAMLDAEMRKRIAAWLHSKLDAPFVG